MADAKKNPSATRHKKPQKRTGSEKGPVSGPQVTGHEFDQKNLPRGSEGDTRRASRNR